MLRATPGPRIVEANHQEHQQRNPQDAGLVRQHLPDDRQTRVFPEACVERPQRLTRRREFDHWNRRGVDLRERDDSVLVAEAGDDRQGHEQARHDHQPS